MYSNFEQLLLKTAEGKDITAEFDFVCEFYKTDLDPQTLQAQLLTFGVEYQQKQSGTNKARYL